MKQTGALNDSAHWSIPKPRDVDDDERYEGLLLLEPREAYDACIIGVVERFNDRFVLYSKECVLEKMSEMFVPDGGDAREEAEEYFYSNTLGGWFGDTTPGFIEDE